VISEQDERDEIEPYTLYLPDKKVLNLKFEFEGVPPFVKKIYEMKRKREFQLQDMASRA